MSPYSDAYLGVESPTSIRIIVDEREAFDALPTPAVSLHNYDLKLLASGDVSIIFQCYKDESHEQTESNVSDQRRSSPALPDLQAQCADGPQHVHRAHPAADRPALPE
jgi:hypothetical protein